MGKPPVKRTKIPARKQKGPPPSKPTPRPKEKHLRDEALEQRLLAHFAKAPHPETPDQAATALGLSPVVVERLLKSLHSLGSLARTRQHAYALPARLGLITGKVVGGAGEACWLHVEGEQQRYYIPPEGRQGALHGDLVWTRLQGGDRVRVERILFRANETVIGQLRLRGRRAYVVPENKRLPERIPLSTRELMGAKDGDLIVARMLRYEDEGGLSGCVQQVLGDADQIKSGLAAILFQSGFEQAFDQRVLSQATEVAAWDIQAEAKTRLDLRHLTAFTIDGPDAQDFDDALTVERLERGKVRLGVHIADVSFYVRPGSMLDEEAKARATSVYLPGLTLPMLPEALSNGVCSLMPGQDRLAFSVLMEVDSQGAVVDYQLHRTVIRSRERLIYEDVNRLLEGDDVLCARYGALVDDLSLVAQVSAKCRARREARGSLDFDMEEAAIQVDAQGEPVNIGRRERGVSHRMIEDCMIQANELVAAHAQKRDLPFLYRVHELPDPERMTAFATFLQNLGLRIPGGTEAVTPMALQQVLEQAEGLPEYAVVARLMIRAMAKARYAPQPLGHFGLAAADYSHFTAPIRRYPDLFIHRVLAAEAEGTLAPLLERLKGQAASLAVHTSEREQAAMQAERAADKLMMARYMQRHIGETYEAVITSTVEWGFFAALPNTVEGLVHVRHLGDDFTLHRQQYALVGMRTGMVYRVGQAVRVTVEKVDVAQRQIDFVLA